MHALDARGPARLARGLVQELHRSGAAGGYFVRHVPHGHQGPQCVLPAVDVDVGARGDQNGHRRGA
eukprot:4101318-Lingulodinium_polyedra.AAC.1